MLVVDVGNSRIKWAIAESGTVRDWHACSRQGEETERLLTRYWSRYPEPAMVWVCSVAGPGVARVIERWCAENWRIRPSFAAVSEVCCGLRNGYREPAQLGVDRWLAMIAAWHAEHSATLVVDCGTAITVDLVTAGGQHAGGLIVPGFELMGRLLNRHTHDIHAAGRTTAGLFGRSTAEGIGNGSLHAIVAFIDRMVGLAAETVGSGVRTVLTGGDGPRVQPLLAGPVRYDRELVLRGLAIVAGEH